jgi:hypothetical protein
MIMQLICVHGLVPNILDSLEWKELMHILNPGYDPTSAEKFSNTIIPKEAAFVRKEQLKVLQESLAARMKTGVKCPSLSSSVT